MSQKLPRDRPLYPTKWTFQARLKGVLPLDIYIHVQISRAAKVVWHDTTFAPLSMRACVTITHQNNERH